MAKTPISDEFHPMTTSICVPAASEKTLMYSLLTILGVALGLRLWGISFGLPYDFTPDEVHEIVRALKLGAQLSFV